MSAVEETVKKFYEGYGKPREGFEEFLKSCKHLDPFLDPTSSDLCKGYFTPSGQRLHALMIQPYYDSRTMEARDSDVIVASYPKTGTTWTEEICYLILSNVDLKKANSATLEERIPFLEIPAIGLKGIEELQSPRLIKTHLPYKEIPSNFLKNGAKIVYITRNPKDTLVSYYNFMRMVGFFAYSGDLQSFLDLFITDQIMYNSFSDHVLEFWRRRHDDNVLFLTYEGLQKNFKYGIEKIANFLGKEISKDQVDQVAQHCNFDSMSKNPMTNYSQGGAAIKAPGCTGSFMRKGKVGDWRNHFTDEMSKKMDLYIEKHFAGTGLEFDYGT